MTAAAPVRTATTATPVAGDVLVEELPDQGDGMLRARADIRISATEPVFAGHYPGFPIFPGVCVIECVRRAGVAVLGGAVELAAIESCRFMGPAFDGDSLSADLTIKGLQLTAVVQTARGTAAKIKLRYREAS
jgi:3-hydroxyacyl-[acyl-carrier-protein] dehydratase